MSIIISDHRENNGALPYLSADCDANNTTNSKLAWKAGAGEIKHKILNNSVYGDYAILLEHENQFHLMAVFERKTWKDLAGSIKDGRLDEQHHGLQQLQDQYNCQIFYIFEGPVNNRPGRKFAGIQFKNLYAKARSLMIQGYPYFQTCNAAKTSELLVLMARDYMRLYRQEKIQLGNPLPAGGFEKILTTPKTQSSGEELIKLWTSVPYVSAKSAQILAKHIDFLELVNSQINIQQIAELTFDSGTVFGKAKAAKILAQIKNPVVQLKILTSIKTVSKPKAQIILSSMEFTDFLNLNWNPVDLKHNERCFGKSLYSKIKTLFHTTNGSSK